MRKGKKGKKTTTVFKKKVDKVKAAKAKLKQMQKSGFWGAPPRRAASLNAAAMVHFMYDNEQIQPKMAISPPTKATTSGVVGNAVENSGSKEANSSSPPSKTTTKSPKLDSNLKKKQSNTKSKQTAASSEDEDKMLSTKLKTSSASNTNKNNSAKINKNHNQPIYSSDENSSSNSSSSDSSDDDSDDDRGNHNKRSSATKANSQGGKKGQQTAKNKAKKKKSLKDEFQMDIKDMIVKKRLASLNASAIMSASYAQERPKDAQGKKDGRGHPGSVVTGIYHSEL